MSGFPLSPPAGSNRLVVVATNDNHGQRVGSVTFDGRPMHEVLGARAEMSPSSTALWYLLDAELPGPGSYDIVVTSVNWLDFRPAFSIQVSSWTGVLQQVNGAPFGESSATHSTSGSATSITSVISTDTAGSLVLSAAGHDDDVGDGGTTGSTRIDFSRDGSNDGSFATSYAIVPDASSYSVTESFDDSHGDATTQALVAFRPASWGPLEFGAVCESGLGPFSYNGDEVMVACTKPSSDVVDVTSTATGSDGHVAVASATITRLPSGTIEITQWDTRGSG